MLALTQGLMSLGIAGGGSPILEEITATAFSATTTSHTAAYPATVAAGDLIIFYVSVRASTAVTITTPAGLSALENTEPGTGFAVGVFWQTAAGTEGGGAIDFVTSRTATMAVQCYRIRAGTWSSTPQVVGASTSSSTPDPPAITTGWAGLEVFYIAAAQVRDASTTSVYPYSDNNTYTISGGTNQASVSTCTTVSTSATENPSVFNISISRQSRATTLGVRPA